MLLYTTPARRLLLCAGTQSSGSTLLSWCFLQRRGVDGILDARFDVLPELPAAAKSADYPWVKITVACFSLTDTVEHFRDEGWDVSPVLLVRDVRAVFNSLLIKEYGRNATTADDPPIRLRLRRFKRDWEQARREGWTIVRYEDLVESPRETLEVTCKSLGIPWDDGMLSWPKKPEEIADARHGNRTFMTSLNPAAGEKGATDTDSYGGGAARCFKKPGPLKLDRVPAEDLVWLEQEFADFNLACGYPSHVDSAVPLPEGRAVPRYEVSRRYWRQHHGLKEVVRKLKASVGITKA